MSDKINKYIEALNLFNEKADEIKKSSCKNCKY